MVAFTVGRRCAVGTGVWIVWLALFTQGAALAAPCPCERTKAYVDCAKQRSGKGTEKDPYNTLGAVNGLRLGPGSAIRLRRGTACKGTLNVNGSGAKSEPITVGAYGKGATPKIDAGGAAQAVLISGREYVEVSDLELTAPGDGTKPRRGVYVYAKDTGTRHGIAIGNLDIHDVGGQRPTTGEKDRGRYADASGGIVVEAQGTATPTAFDGLKITGNRIHKVDRQGVSLWSAWCRRPDLAPKWRPTCAQAWAPAKHVAVSGNLLWDVGGDGIAAMTTQGATIERNLLQGFGVRPRGTGVSTVNSTDATITGNEVSAGGLAFEIGKAAEQTMLRANLSHDNQGGFAGLHAAANAPVRDFVVTGNVTVNDHAQQYDVTGPLSDGQILGNTAYIGASVDQLIVDANTDAELDVRFTGNLLLNASAGTVGWNLDSPGWVLDRNLLRGVPIPAAAKNTVKDDPSLLAAGLPDPVGYRLRAGSPALGTGIRADGLSGYPLSPVRVPAGTPNIGAAQAPAAFPVSLADAFNGAAGKPPPGWAISGAATVAADPAGFTGHSLTIKRSPSNTSAGHAFPATGGDLRVGARLWAGQAGASASMSVLDGAGRRIAGVGIDAAGHLVYSDGTGIRTTSYAVPVRAWLRVSLLLRPESGSYDLAVGDTTLATGKLAPGGGMAGQVAVEVPGGTGGGSFAIDDVLVTPECCACRPPS